MPVLPRIGYYAPHLASSLNDMSEKLDKPVQKLLRNLSSNMPSFPTKLRHIPKNMSGLEFKFPTDTITTTKTQSTPTVERCNKHNSGDADETAMGKIPRRTTS